MIAETPEIVGTLSDGAHNGGGLNGQDTYTGRIFATREMPDRKESTAGL